MFKNIGICAHIFSGGTFIASNGDGGAMLPSKASPKFVCERGILTYIATLSVPPFGEPSLTLGK